jgi:hypothetical protein
MAGARLPVRSIGDVRLAAHLEGPDCPLCATRLEAARRYIESILWESVNDVGFRARLVAGRGFCRVHSRQTLSDARAAGRGTLGVAILFSASLRVRLAELGRVPVANGSRSKRAGDAIDAAAKPADCPVCEQVAAAHRIAVDSLGEHLAEPEWRMRLAAARLCLDDLNELWSHVAVRRTPWWPDVAKAQLARLGDVADQLDGFAYHSSFDRRELMTDAEREACDDASLILGGSTADGTA